MLCLRRILNPSTTATVAHLLYRKTWQRPATRQLRQDWTANGIQTQKYHTKPSEPPWVSLCIHQTGISVRCYSVHFTLFFSNPENVIRVAVLLDAILVTINALPGQRSSAKAPLYRDVTTNARVHRFLTFRVGAHRLMARVSPFCGV